MKKFDLRTLIFLAMCCNLGLFSKRLVAPLANLVCDPLHIPGGVGTSFSLMFLAVAGALSAGFGCATAMGAVQSVLALAFGMVGSMGALSFIGYILPGVVIDLVLAATGRMEDRPRLMLVNGLAAVCASLTANLIVFRLWGVPLLLYVCVSASSGALCGMLGADLVRRLRPVLGQSVRRREGRAGT